LIERQVHVNDNTAQTATKIHADEISPEDLDETFRVRHDEPRRPARRLSEKDGLGGLDITSPEEIERQLARYGPSVEENVRDAPELAEVIPIRKREFIRLAKPKESQEELKAKLDERDRRIREHLAMRAAEKQERHEVAQVNAGPKDPAYRARIARCTERWGEEGRRIARYMDVGPKPKKVSVAEDFRRPYWAHLPTADSQSQLVFTKKPVPWIPSMKAPLFKNASIESWFPIRSRRAPGQRNLLAVTTRADRSQQHSFASRKSLTAQCGISIWQYKQLMPELEADSPEGPAVKRIGRRGRRTVREVRADLKEGNHRRGYEWIFVRTEISKAAKLILVEIAHDCRMRQDAHFELPSYRVLAEKIGIPRQTAYRAVQDLLKWRLIDKTEAGYRLLDHPWRKYHLDARRRAIQLHLPRKPGQ
jgi:hypothetical protein